MALQYTCMMNPLCNFSISQVLKTQCVHKTEKETRACRDCWQPRPLLDLDDRSKRIGVENEKLILVDFVGRR